MNVKHRSLQDENGSSVVLVSYERYYVTCCKDPYYVSENEIGNSDVTCLACLAYDAPRGYCVQCQVLDHDMCGMAKNCICCSNTRKRIYY